MNCNCIKEVEEKVNDLFKQEHGDKEIVESISITQKALMLTKGGGVQLHGKVLGKYLDGKRNRKFEMNLTFKYCPFCGKAYKKE